jgi:hypothetical protein
MTTRIAFALAISGAVVAGQAPAAAESTPDSLASGANAELSQGVFVNPIGLLVGILGAEYSFAVSDAATIALAPGFVYFNASSGTSTARVTGGEMKAGMQFFPGGGLFRGVYVYPHLTAGYVSLEENTSSASVVLFGGGAIAGYQWTWSGGFSLRLGAGAGYIQAAASDGDTTVELSGVGPRLEGMLGYAW